jgi:hypothetical protein
MIYYFIKGENTMFEEESMNPEEDSLLPLIKKKEVLPPMQAFRAKCMDCTCNQPKEIKFCSITDCAIWPYRMGNNPKRAGVGGKGRRFEKREVVPKSAGHQISKLIEPEGLTSVQRQCYSHVRRNEKNEV